MVASILEVELRIPTRYVLEVASHEGFAVPVHGCKAERMGLGFVEFLGHVSAVAASSLSLRSIVDLGVAFEVVDFHLVVCKLVFLVVSFQWVLVLSVCRWAVE